MIPTLSLLLFLLGHNAGPKPLAGYAEVVVERFSIDKECDVSAEQADAVQRQLVTKLRARKIAAIIDCTVEEGAALAKERPAEGIRRMTIRAVVVEFAHGNRAARTIGIGAGATKLRVRFTLKDAVSGAELLSTERLGRYSGRGASDGGTFEAGFNAAAVEVADGLVGEIEKNR